MRLTLSNMDKIFHFRNTFYYYFTTIFNCTIAVGSALRPRLISRSIRYAEQLPSFFFLSLNIIRITFIRRYEKALRVTEASATVATTTTSSSTTATTAEPDESHPVVSSGGGAAARLGVQYSADYYQVIKRIRASAEARYQRKTDPSSSSAAADSLVERLKWLTTDVDDPEESGGVGEEREAADGGSDPEILQLTAVATAAAAPDENAPLSADEQAGFRPVAIPAGGSELEANNSSATTTSSNSSTAATAAVVSKPSKSGSEKSSTYRKLNELFFRSKSKDKNKDTSNKSGGDDQQWKTSSSSLNRSFSPPPPAEVEPKMKPSKKPHLIHIVGLGSKSSAASNSSGTSGEMLGRIPNVVPTVDHVYRAAVDLVTRNPSAGFASGADGQQQQYASSGASGGAQQIYSLDDIDAALHAQMTGAGGGAEAASSIIYMPSHRIPEDSRDDTGGSRSSGSSGDSGLGSSHDTSLTGTDTDGSAHDELQAFVRQDATQGRIDRIKKRYSAALEDEAEDYGFLRRPSVRGIKTRFGSTSEIIQQMQAQLTPVAAVAAAKASGQTHVNWSSYADADQSSIQAQALLDPREKRRSAMLAMSNSIHLPALPEDSYFHAGGGGSAVTSSQIRRDIPSRPSSVMNIYGSTGDLYQHLRAPIRPVVVRHPPSSAAAVVAHHPPHLLERTSSVSSVSSAVDNGIYGTIRRQPPPTQMVYMAPSHPDSVSPTRGDYAVMVHPQQYQQQIPLRMTVSNPNSIAYGSQQQQQQLHIQQQQQPQQQRPVSQMSNVAAYYPSAQDYALQQQFQQQQQHYVYATLPAKRQSPYGVPAQVVQQQSAQAMPPLDATRYRQVLPQSQVALRPSSALADPRYSVPVHGLQPQQAAAAAAAAAAASASSASGAPPLKDEREGPEGASSSPGLTHHDVNM